MKLYFLFKSCHVCYNFYIKYIVIQVWRSRWFFVMIFCVIEFYCNCSIKYLSQTISTGIPNPNLTRSEVKLPRNGRQLTQTVEYICVPQAFKETKVCTVMHSWMDKQTEKIVIALQIRLIFSSSLLLSKQTCAVMISPRTAALVYLYLWSWLYMKKSLQSLYTVYNGRLN